MVHVWVTSILTGYIKKYIPPEDLYAVCLVRAILYKAWTESNTKVWLYMARPGRPMSRFRAEFPTLCLWGTVRYSAMIPVRKPEQSLSFQPIPYKDSYQRYIYIPVFPLHLVLNLAVNLTWLERDRSTWWVRANVKGASPFEKLYAPRSVVASSHMKTDLYN